MTSIDSQSFSYHLSLKKTTVLQTEFPGHIFQNYSHKLLNVDNDNAVHMGGHFSILFCSLAFFFVWDRQSDRSSPSSFSVHLCKLFFSCSTFHLLLLKKEKQIM